MELQKINSFQELQEALKGKERAFLLLYKEGSPQSECALKNLESADIPADKVALMKANVAEVRDIHPVYNISSVPTLLEFVQGEFKMWLRAAIPLITIKPTLKIPCLVPPLQPKAKLPRKGLRYTLHPPAPGAMH